MAGERINPFYSGGDILLSVKEDTSEILGVVKKRPKVYGFKRLADEPNPSNRIQYLFDAVGMTPAKMEASAFNYGSWKDIWFMRDNYPCMLNGDGTEAYRLNPNNYGLRADTGAASDWKTTTGTLNAMSAIPTVWVKRWMEGDDECVAFCEDQYDESFKAYAHTRADGSIRQYTYYPIYRGWKDTAGLLRSISGQYPWTVTGGTEPERTAAQKNGANWDIVPWSKRILIMDLLTLISKTDDSEAAFGHGQTSGYVNNAEQHYGLVVNGTLDTKGQFWGDLTNTTAAVKVFHIENFWGCRWERLIGLVQKGGSYLVKMTPEGTGYNLTGVGYEAFPQGLTTGTASGSGFQVKTATSDLGTLPVGDKFNGTSATYTADGFWYNAGITAIGLAGGACDAGAHCGSRYLSVNAAATASLWTFGGSPSYN